MFNKIEEVSYKKEKLFEKIRISRHLPEKFDSGKYTNSPKFIKIIRNQWFTMLILHYKHQYNIVPLPFCWRKSHRLGSWEYISYS